MKILIPNCPQPQSIPEGMTVKCLVCNSTFITEKNEGGWPATDLLPQIAWRKLCSVCNQPLTILKPSPDT